MTVNKNKAIKEIEKYFKTNGYDIEVEFIDYNRVLNRKESQIYIVKDNEYYYVDLIDFPNMTELLNTMVDWWSGNYKELIATVESEEYHPKKVNVNTFSGLSRHELIVYKPIKIEFSFNELVKAINKYKSSKLNNLEYIASFYDIDTNTFKKCIKKSIDKEKHIPFIPENFQLDLLDINMDYFQYMEHRQPDTVLKAIEKKSNLKYITPRKEYDKTLMKVILKLSNTKITEDNIKKLHKEFIRKHFVNMDEEIIKTIMSFSD